MKRVSVFLSEPQIAGFQALAKELGRPISELIREALDDFLRHRRGPPTRKPERKRAVTRKRP